MDTEHLLKVAQEYFEHEYAPYVGGASLLAGAAVWFYATDISRIVKVSPVETGGAFPFLTPAPSIPPIAPVINKSRVKHPFPVHEKTPASHDSYSGMCLNSTIVRFPNCA